MKFFTPELYLKNQLPDEEGQKAELDWDVAIEGYRKALRGSPEWSLPISSLCLHDAPVLSRYESDGKFIVQLGHGMTEIPCTLCYSLSGKVLATQHPGFPDNDQEDWLYDEVIGMTHNILFSSGLELEIPFSSVEIVGMSGPKLFTFRTTAKTNLSDFFAEMRAKFPHIIGRKLLCCYDTERTPELDGLVERHNVEFVCNLNRSIGAYQFGIQH